MYTFCSVNVSGGAVVRSDGNRERAYIGRDGYWARSRENATPFATLAEARSLESTLTAENDRIYGRRRNRDE